MADQNVQHEELIYPGLVVKLHDGRWVCITRFKKIEDEKPLILFEAVDRDGEVEWPLTWPKDVKWRVGDLDHDFIKLGEHRHAQEVVRFIMKVFNYKRENIETLKEPNETVF